MSTNDDDSGQKIMSSSNNHDEDSSLHTISLYFALFAGLLATVMILSKLLHESIYMNQFISEASMVLLLGTFAGFLVYTFSSNYHAETSSNNNDYYDGEEYDDDDDDNNLLAHSLLSFSPNVFFMGLLPPIMFNSGYQLRRELFYRHIQPIVMFACIGTTICAVCTGFILYGIGELGLFGNNEFNPSMLELLTFGALIAATDTVSVLGVFQAKKVDPHLFYLVFGESCLNDACAIVLFSTFADLLRTDFDNAKSMALRGVQFVITLTEMAIGSPLLGIIFSFGAALIFKYIDFRRYPKLELPLYMLMMYTPFIVAECLHISGIVAIFFSGISARRYIAPNISKITRQNAEVMFSLASYLAETCIFLELGLSVFGLPGSFNWLFIIWAFIASLIGRAIGIYPLAFLNNLSLKEIQKVDDYPLNSNTATAAIISDNNNNNDEVPSTTTTPFGQTAELDTTTNSDADSISSTLTDTSNNLRRRRRRKLKTPQRRRDKRVTWEEIHIIWFAGLRGAVAYACVRKFPNLYGHADEFIATTMSIVLFSIIVMGGLTESLLKALNIPMGVDEEEYMKNWRKTKRLKGRIHKLENKYIYGFIVRDAIRSDGDSVATVKSQEEEEDDDDETVTNDDNNEDPAFLYQMSESSSAQHNINKISHTNNTSTTNNEVDPAFSYQISESLPQQQEQPNNIINHLS